jgi:hypothetical protein
MAMNGIRAGGWGLVAAAKRQITALTVALLVTGSAPAQDAGEERAAEPPASTADSAARVAKTSESAGAETKTLSGISILGNQEAPKSLVIVPWKGSEMGDMPGLSRLLDDAVQPVDKDVFMRELFYYEIRSSR